MSEKGMLVVISGFSGAGKGTVVKQICDSYPYALSISATSRTPRKGDVDGKNYFFKSREEFEQMIAAGELIEWVEYVGNYYGTPKSYIQEQRQLGNDVMLEIEMEGALNVKKVFPDAILVFLTPPSASELKKRLVGRGTETEEEIAKRLKRASEECAYMPSYDYIVINDNLEACAAQVHSIVQSEKDKTRSYTHLLAKNCKPLIDRMTKELQELIAHL